MYAISPIKMSPSVIKHHKKRSPTKKKTNEVTMYLIPTNSKVKGKCLTNIRNHGHYTQCETSASKKLYSLHLDGESSFINCGLSHICRPESPQTCKHFPCKVIFENEAAQNSGKVAMPEIVSILKPTFTVTDKKILCPPFKVTFKKKSMSTQCVTKKYLKTKPLSPCLRFKGSIPTSKRAKVSCGSPYVTIHRQSKVKFEEKLQLTRLSSRKRHWNKYQTIVELNKIDFQSGPPTSELVGNLEISNKLICKETLKSIDLKSGNDGAFEKMNVIVENKVSKTEFLDASILQQTCFGPTSNNDNEPGLIESASCNQEFYSFCNTICTNTPCDGMLDVPETWYSEPQCFCKCDCNCDHMKGREDSKITSCECETQTSECNDTCPIGVEDDNSSSPKKVICKIGLSKRKPVNIDDSESCMLIIDFPDLITVVVHNTSQSSSGSAGHLVSSSLFTDQNNAIINKSRMLTMRRMLLRQQELMLAEVEEVKKTKSLKNYVSNVTEVFITEIRKLRNKMANLNWLS